MESKKDIDVWLIVPLTLPGFDKEKIAQILKELLVANGYEYHIVSIKHSKAALSKTLEENVEAAPKIDKFDFKVVQRLGNKKFYDELQAVVRTVVKKSRLSQNLTEKPTVIFLCKNHPPNAWNRLERFIKEQKALRIKRIGLCADYDKQNGLNLNGERYLFDEVTVLNCLARVLDRDLPYETIRGTDAEKLSVVGTFIGMYRDTLTNYQMMFDGIFEVRLFDLERSNAKLASLGSEERAIRDQLFNQIAIAINEQGELTEELKEKGVGIGIANSKGEDIPWQKVQDELLKLFKKLSWEYYVLPDYKIADSLKKDFERLAKELAKEK